MESTNEPRPAATTVILRDGPEGLEVLLTQRPERLRFMGGAVVFPGGAVAPSDLDSRWEKASTLSRAEAADALGSSDEAAALGAFVCALREAFEEVGFVTGQSPVPRLERHEASSPELFLERCLQPDARLGTRDLVPAGRWVTPLGSPVRFDARFFLVRAPDGWEPDPDRSEVARCYWMTPGMALEQLAAGDALMAPPTIETLQRLAEHGDVDAAIEGLAEHRVGDPHILSVRLSPLVQVVLAPNPSPMTGPGTNTYIVGSGPTFVIDPAVDDGRFVDAVTAAANRVAAILVTHRHLDHVGGVAAIRDRTGAPVRAWGEELAGEVAVQPLQEDEVLGAGGARLRVIHAPGHASDHVCFLFEGAASLFAGDNILGEGTSVIAPPDGNMREYLQTLSKLKELHIDRIYPGHFRPLDGGTAVIEGYIAHRREREAAITDVLAQGPVTVDEIVASVYTDTPEALHPIARVQVEAMLQMLMEDGRVTEKQKQFHLLDR